MLQAYKNKIITGDCLEILSQIEDNSVDVCFADPPFNLNKKYHRYRDNRTTEEYLAWSKHWLAELVRITKPTGSIFIHNIPKWLIHYTEILNRIAYFKHWIVWDALGWPCGKTLLPAHYGILMYTKQPNNYTFYPIRAPHKTCRACATYLKDYGSKARHPFGSLLSDVWTDIYRLRHVSLRRAHPCQLPEHLMERIILMSSNVGDIILDPFSGTGTTAVAAKKLLRQFVAIDIDDCYAAIAKERLRQAKPTTIRGIPISSFLGKVMTLRDSDFKKLSFATPGTKWA